MKRFEVGKTYYTRSTCQHDCIFSFTVTKRTDKMVTVIDGIGNTYRRKINVSTYRKEPEEIIYPYGVYSMCAVIGATDDFIRP